MIKPYGVIYKITNAINGKVYIGQTVQGMDVRWREHLKVVRSGGGYALHNAIRKYGIQQFSIEELYQCSSQEELNSEEISYIHSYYSIIDHGRGYNLDTGGGSHGSPSNETLRKMIYSQNRDDVKAKIQASRAGYRHSDETKRKMSESSKGQEMSLEARLKMSVAKKGKPGSFLGHHHTEETKIKVGLTGKGRIPWNKGKKGIFSPQVIERIRQARLAQPDPRLGRKHSVEAKEKMRLAKIVRVRNS